jgi:ribulose bisphosphate carboxylase small subunit
MTKPDYTINHWNLRASDNTVRVCLEERHDIGYYYTSMSRIGDSGTWEHIEGSSVGHGSDRGVALASVEKLIKTYKVFS